MMKAMGIMKIMGMMGTIKKTVTLLALIAAAFPVYSQAGLAVLDGECAEAASRIKTFVFSNAEFSGRGIEVSSFSSGGLESPLGNFWRENLVNLLGPDVMITAPGRGDYILGGEILDLGQSVRIFTRIRDKNGRILSAWTNDLAKTPFLEGLLPTASGAAVSRDAYEEDSESAPVPVSIDGDSLMRTLHNNDTDWFLITPAADAFVLMETSGSMDTLMELFEKTGSGSRKIRQDDDSGQGENARILHQLQGGKNYLVLVKPYSGETGRYGFSAKTAELPDRDLEPNDTKESASPIEPGQELRAYLYSGDRDWYVFTLDGPQAVSITAGGNAETGLNLYDSRGIISTAGSSGRIAKTLEAGTYYIQAVLRGDPGEYALMIRVRTVVNPDAYEDDNSVSEAKEIRPGEKQRHNFSDSEDEDWVVFTVDRPGMYRIRAYGETDMDLDTAIVLLKGDEQIAEDDDGGDGYSALLRRRLEPGTYYIGVFCLDRYPEDHYILELNRE